MFGVIANVILFLQLCVVVHVVMGWFGADPKHPLVKVVATIVEPMLKVVAAVARKLKLPLVWDPLILLVCLHFVRQLFR